MLQVRFVGGDKPSGYLKDIDCEEVQAYKAALAEMVRAVAIAVALGKGPTDFAQWRSYGDLIAAGATMVYVKYVKL